MIQNPYESPKASISGAMGNGNRFGQIGFVLSFTGILGLLVVGPFGPIVGEIGMYETFLCLPGLLVSVIGLFRRPRHLAGWGMVIGTFGSHYVPTFYGSLFGFPLR